MTLSPLLIYIFAPFGSPRIVVLTTLDYVDVLHGDFGEEVLIGCCCGGVGEPFTNGQETLCPAVVVHLTFHGLSIASTLNAV